MIICLIKYKSKIFIIDILKSNKMSDNSGQKDEEYEWPSDGEEQNDDNEGEVMKKNEFYEAEDLKKSNPTLALEKFENVVILEE